MSKARLMQGNEACAEGAIAAGVNFFAGYPITPSTEIAETMARLLPKHGGKFVQMEDEIASMGAILGASLAGSKVMDATSGPGFSLKQELIGYAACAEIPCVLVDVQRVGPSTASRPRRRRVMSCRRAGARTATILSSRSRRGACARRTMRRSWPSITRSASARLSSCSWTRSSAICARRSSCRSM